MDATKRQRVAVIGGGIAGLAAAHHLTASGISPVDVDVYEGAADIGGKLALGEVGGVIVDLGAESMLARRPEAVELAEAVGLGDDIVHPATTAASIWSRGELHPMPTGHVMGVPGDLRALAATGLLSQPGLARVRLDRVLPRSPQHGDVAIGKYVASRLGREVVDRLIEPLLGGVYAGHADELSLRATVPQLVPLATSGASLTCGVRDLVAERAVPPGQPTPPVFAGIRGGIGRLPRALARELGERVHTNATVRELDRTETGWRLVIGPTREPTVVEADAVILALPARPASRLLADISPVASAELAGIEYASVALATFVFPAAAFREPLPGSGFLVPPVENKAIKASTFSSVKWSWLGNAAHDLVVIRASLGRHRGEDELRRDDDELLEIAAADLSDALRLVGAEADVRPVAWRLHRWGGALPQYAVGHLDRVARVRQAVARVPGLAVCGAAYDGVGIPAVIASARRAADEVVASLAPSVTPAAR
jgi:oxygen-dependent protoporphyrinogen oxidase